MSEELSRCPFCGGEAEEWSHHIEHCGDGCTAYNIGCRKSDCLGMLSAAVCGPWGYKKEGDLPNNETARSLAIEKWNTRHLPADVGAVLELLKTAICIDCGGSGEVYADNGEAGPCQWCEEKDAAIRNYDKGRTE